MKIKTLKIRITLQEEMLGMSAAQDVHEKYIASRAPDAPSIKEEVEALGEELVLENKRTVFPRDNGTPIMWDYQIKGMFKDSCGMLRRVSGSESSKLTSYKKNIDGLIFVGPRKISIDTKGQPLGNCQRPLRADTAQGPRVALADSETAPAGSTIEFEVRIMEPTKKKGAPSLEDCVLEWLQYGQLRGLGQWRNAGKGIYSFEIIN